eukprot:364664-Chlamydomonas_euryale.AAC.11
MPSASNCNDHCLAANKAPAHPARASWTATRLRPHTAPHLRPHIVTRAPVRPVHRARARASLIATHFLESLYSLLRKNELKKWQRGGLATPGGRCVRIDVSRSCESV